VNGGPLHPGDLLSAYADGELTSAERAAVDAHLGICPACRQELEGTRRAKAWIAALPEIEAPFGFLERMLLDPSDHRRRRDRWARIGAVSLAAAASVWLAVVGFSGLTANPSGGVPALNSLVSRHEEATPPNTVADDDQQHQTEQEAAALGMPEAMGVYRVLSVAELGQPRQMTYASDDEWVSAFVYLGYDIAEAHLPAGATERVLSNRRAWVVRMNPWLVVLVQVGSNAVVLVGPEPAPVMADDLEPRSPDPSLMDRIEGAGEGLLEAFGLG
jgi:hypothetical protein